MTKGKRSARDKETVRRLREMGGTWHATTKTWRLPSEGRAALEQLLADLGYSRRTAHYERSGDKRKDER